MGVISIKTGCTCLHVQFCNNFLFRNLVENTVGLKQKGTKRTAETGLKIANDAIDMSVFIMDNLGLDTSDHALSVYADAEMLVFQNKHAEALEQLKKLLD